MQHVRVGADKIEKRLPWLDLAWIFKHWMLVNPLSILWTKVSGLRSRFVEINLLQMSYITLSDLVSKRLSAHLRKIEKIFQSWIIVLLLLIFFKTLLPIFCWVTLAYSEEMMPLLAALASLCPCPVWPDLTVSEESEMRASCDPGLSTRTRGRLTGRPASEPRCPVPPASRRGYTWPLQPPLSTGLWPPLTINWDWASAEPLGPGGTEEWDVTMCTGCEEEVTSDVMRALQPV